MFSGNYFSYNGVNSEKYELMIASIDSEENSQIGGSLEYSVFYGKNGRAKIQRSRFPDSAFSFGIELCRAGRRPIGYAEHQSICRDFFNSPGFQKMQILDGEYSGLYFYAYITDVEKYDHEMGVIGYKGTVVCDSPYMWEDKSYAYSFVDRTNSVNLYNNTLLPFYTQADLSFVTGSEGGTVTIARTAGASEDAITFQALPANTSVTLNYDPKQIVIDNEAYRQTIFEDNNHWNKKWLTLLQGDNLLRISGDVAQLGLSYQTAKAVF